MKPEPRNSQTEFLPEPQARLDSDMLFLPEMELLFCPVGLRRLAPGTHLLLFKFTLNSLTQGLIYFLLNPYEPNLTVVTFYFSVDANIVP